MIILLYLYPLMGLIHIISAIVRLCFDKRRYPEYKKKLANYLLIVAIYFLIIVLFSSVKFLSELDLNGLAFIYICVIPWFIAAYYWTIIYNTEEEPALIESTIINTHS